MGLSLLLFHPETAFSADDSSEARGFCSFKLGKKGTLIGIGEKFEDL